VVSSEAGPIGTFLRLSGGTSGSLLRWTDVRSDAAESNEEEEASSGMVGNGAPNSEPG
jgi:hypothetical protein